MSSEFENLVNKAKTGDVNAFGELYEKFAKEMYRFAFYYTSSPVFAEDAVSEATLSAFEKIGSLKKAESFKSWLFKILFVCCRKKQREKADAKNLVELSQIRNFEAKETDYIKNLELKKALDCLSEDERKIIVLSFALGYDTEEIAAMLEMKSGTVRSKKSRAAAKMRNILAD